MARLQDRRGRQSIPTYFTFTLAVVGGLSDGLHKFFFILASLVDLIEPTLRNCRDTRIAPLQRCDISVYPSSPFHFPTMESIKHRRTLVV